jgi:GrpB-like predicted nucleotidyltransferase (UPF0157 family)
MTDHAPMPVSGYTSQPQTNVDLANEGKAHEEQYLRWLDKLAAHPDTDKRNVAIAKTHMEEAAMRAIRSIFKPQRIKLPGDAA